MRASFRLMISVCIHRPFAKLRTHSTLSNGTLIAKLKDPAMLGHYETLPYGPITTNKDARLNNLAKIHGLARIKRAF